jgi:hypothetical protein
MLQDNAASRGSSPHLLATLQLPLPVGNLLLAGRCLMPTRRVRLAAPSFRDDQRASGPFLLTMQLPLHEPLRLDDGICSYLQGRLWRSTELGLQSSSQGAEYACCPPMAAIANALAGNIEEARQFMAKHRQFVPAMRITDLSEHLPLRRPQDFERYVEGMRLAGLPE